MGRRVWILACDSNKPIGGVLQLYRLAEILNSLDYQSSIVVNTDNFTPSWFSSSVSSISYDRLRSLPLHSSSDLLIIPETLVYLKHLWRGLPTVIFNQNATYTLGVPPKFYNKSDTSSLLKNYLDPDIVQVLSVSSYDISYLSTLLHLPDSSLSLIANFVDPLFAPCLSKINQICYMPRKNFYLQQVFFAFLRQSNLYGRFSFVPIHNLPHDLVASELQKSVCFLNFGFPEGFGLPVAESLACLTPVVGFNQLGTLDIYDIVSGLDVFFPASYGDHLSFWNAFKSFADSYFLSKDKLFGRLQQASSLIRTAYSHDAMYKSVAIAFQRIEARL